MPQPTSKNTQVPFGAGIPIHYTSPQNQVPLIPLNQPPPLVPNQSSSNIYPNLNQCAPFSYLYPNQMPKTVNSTSDYMRKVHLVNVRHVLH